MCFGGQQKWSSFLIYFEKGKKVLLNSISKTSVITAVCFQFRDGNFIRINSPLVFLSKTRFEILPVCTKYWWTTFDKISSSPKLLIPWLTILKGRPNWHTRSFQRPYNVRKVHITLDEYCILLKQRCVSWDLYFHASGKSYLFQATGLNWKLNHNFSRAPLRPRSLRQTLASCDEDLIVTCEVLIHNMHHLTLHHGPSSRLVTSDVLTDFTSLITNQLLGLQKTLQWCISWIVCKLSSGHVTIVQFPRNFVDQFEH